jgi:hypothetical protein
MGQEIVHCSVCGLRLRSSDFEKGQALRANFTAYCLKCAPEGATAAPPKPVPDSTRKKHDNTTGRIPVVTPRRGTEGVPEKSSPALLWIGGAIALAVMAALAVMMTKSGEAPAPPPSAPTPKAVLRPEAKPAPAPAPARRARWSPPRIRGSET